MTPPRIGGKRTTPLLSALLFLMVALVLCAALGSAATRQHADPDAQLLLRIPTEGLGFQPPSRFYAPYRIPSATLDYLDAQHLLFTFRVSALMRREANEPETDQDQTIRAVVLSLPDGKVTAQRDWRLHDRERYVWPLGSGKFLLRLRDTLLLSDAALHTTVYIKPEGSLVSVQTSPAAQTVALQYEQDAPAGTARDEGRPAGAPTLGDDAPHAEAPRPKQYELVVIDAVNQKGSRIWNMPRVVEVPMVSGGYLTAEQENDTRWTILLASFRGAPRTITHLDSNCRPLLHPLSETAFLAQTCVPRQEGKLSQAFDLQGKQLWAHLWQPRFVWGTYSYAADGSRFAYGSIEVEHPLEELEPVSTSSILGQPVGIFDVTSGKTTAVLDASPILTAGGNFALSPDGSAFAILREGAIELYKLSDAAARPISSSGHAPVP